MHDEIAAVYRRFAAVEAAPRSPVYADLADRIGRDPRTLAFLADLPAVRWQPNLLFAAVQYLNGPLTGWAGFAAALSAQAGAITDLMRTRTVQTNIPARCATLLPALAALPQPLALLEVGASAGLCLHPDRYGYAYDGHPTLPGTPTFHCTASPGTPVPTRPVEVVWRAGLDLHPLDLTDPDDRAWLDALVWPGEEYLRDQLHAAAEVVSADPPLLHRGDLVTDLPELLDQVPSGATAVVFHTAVLSYVDDPADRARFAATVAASPAVWLADEAPERIPGLDPLARTDPHARTIDWIDG